MAFALRERELLGKKRDYSYLFLPDQGWDVTYRGARPVPDEDWQRYIRTNHNDILYMLRYRLKEPGMLVDYIGSDIYVSRHVEIIELTDSTNQTVRVYLDHNTMLPLHQTFAWMDEKTRQLTTKRRTLTSIGMRDRRNVAFFDRASRNGYKAYQQFADKVEINQPLPPEMFDLPPGAKVLKKVQ